MKNFLETLAANNRLGALEGVVEKFAQLISAQRGEVELVVTSAAVRQLQPPIWHFLQERKGRDNEELAML